MDSTDKLVKLMEEFGEQSILPYRRNMTAEERAAIDRLNESSVGEMATQALVGRDGYDKLIHVEPGTKEYRHETRRAIKKSERIKKASETESKS